MERIKSKSLHFSALKTELWLDPDLFPGLRSEALPRGSLDTQRRANAEPQTQPSHPVRATSALNSEFFPRGDYRGQQKPRGGHKIVQSRQNSPKNEQHVSGVTSIHKAIPSPSRRHLVLRDSLETAGCQVKTGAGQLLRSSFHQLVGLGLILGQIHQLLPSFTTAQFSSHALEDTAAILPTD